MYFRYCSLLKVLQLQFFYRNGGMLIPRRQSVHTVKHINNVSITAFICLYMYVNKRQVDDVTNRGF